MTAVSETGGSFSCSLRCGRAAAFGGGDVAAQEAEDLVFAGFRGDLEDIELDEVEQRALVVGQAEEEVFFGDGFGGAAVGADGARGAFYEHFLADGVLAGVGAEVDGAAAVEVGEEFLGAALVGGVGGADVAVVRQAHAVPEGAEGLRDLVGELLGRDAGGGGGALDLLAVLVGAGEEEGVVPQEAVAAGEDVGDDGGVGVADVGARVDVVDRGGDVELFGFWGRHRVRVSLPGGFVASQLQVPFGLRTGWGTSEADCLRE